MMSRSSQKKAESDRLIISNFDSNFIAYTFLDSFILTCRTGGGTRMSSREGRGTEEWQRGEGYRGVAG